MPDSPGNASATAAIASEFDEGHAKTPKNPKLFDWIAARLLPCLATSTQLRHDATG